MTLPPVAGRREIPNLPPAEDRLLAMIAALTSELTIVRERLDTLERIAETTGLFGRDAIECYTPDAVAGAARDEMRQRTIAKVFRPLRDAAARAAATEE